ncbi:MAG TPA: TIGR00282 family metallophosphoesterase [Thermoanaerobaculia bacterium]|nr:TIGR00282 family metallophosphoesterase [Thermoanaerobaculia bacterium]
MRVLFVGDVIGKPGRRVLGRLLPRLIDRHLADYVVVNVENSAGGFGVTAGVLAELEEMPIDCYTSGNHVWDKKEVGELLARRGGRPLLRPANYPGGNPGAGVHVGETPAGIPVAVLNLQGRVFMDPLDDPFRAADRILAELAAVHPELRAVIVDFHAEATSEKQALAFYLDGRVSAVLGTHTHVPTADERVLPGGTVLITDVGMTGPYDSIIGMRPDKVLHRFLQATPASFQVASGDVRLAGAVVDVDEATGKARSVERLLLSDPEQ